MRMATIIETRIELLILLVTIFVSSVACDGELKQTFLTKGNENITIVYKQIGCFKDTKNRSLPVLVGDWSGTLDVYSEIISKCASAAWSKGYKGFGVQFFGECWSGEDAVLTYDKYGIDSTSCFKGVGGHWASNIYFFTNTKPLITDEQLSWKVSSGTVLNLVCHVKSPFAVNITWYKNFDDEDPLSTGHILNVTTNTIDQGYYWCKAKTPYGLGTQSKKALVVVKDYFTTTIKFMLKRNSARTRRSVQLCKPCEQITEYLTEEQLGEFTRGTCRTWSSFTSQVLIECTIYRKRNNQDIIDYYKNIIDRLTQRSSRGNRLPIHWNTLAVKDAEYCVNEATGRSTFKGVFEWGLLTSGQSSTIVCPYGPKGTNATRTCTGNFIEGVSWNNPDEGDCGFNSKKTEEINKLSKVKVNAQNAKQVAKNLTKLFKSYQTKDLTESDAELAADVVNNILAINDKLHETADLVFEVIDTILEMNKTTLANSEKTASKITKALDFLAENIPMVQGKTSRVLKANNVVLQANVINKPSFNGISFAVTQNGSIAENPEETKLSVQLPSSLLRGTDKQSVRIGFIYQANNKLFQTKLDENQTSTASEQVLSSSVYNSNTSSLSEPVTLRFPRPEQTDEDLLLNSTCVFWNEEERQWSDNGCTLCEKNDGSDESTVECCCTHLTSFAVLFSPMTHQPSTKASSSHALALSIITYVGCGISLVGVLLTFVTYLLFRRLRKTNQQPILMNLCVAIALLLIVFVAGVNTTNNRLGCQIVAVLLHYLTLVTVLWMGIEAYNLYLQIVKVMAIYQRKFMLKAALVGWGAPLLVVMATVIAAVVEYKKSDDVGRMFYYGNDYVCVLHNNTYRIITWFTPILAILLLNMVTFFLVVYKLNSTGAMVPVDSISNQRRRCWTAFAIMVLLGLTWLFGALAISDARIVFEYLFCIFNSLQGFFIFFFHCVRIKEVRNQWSFFVSGLGFSHRESESSHQRSKGFGESYHTSEAAFVKVRDWIQKDSDPPQRRETMLTNICSDKHDDVDVDDNSNMDKY